MKSKDSNLSCSSNYTSILFPGLYTIMLNFFIFLKICHRWCVARKPVSNKAQNSLVS